MKASEPKSEPKSDVWVKSSCSMCFSSCGIQAHVVNGVVVKIEGDPDCPQNLGRLCAKGHAAIMGLYNPSRVKAPLKRTNPEKGIGIDPKWVEISWEEALSTIAERLKKIRKDDPRKLAIMSFDLDFLEFFKSVWGSAFGTPNVLTGAAPFFCGNGLHPMQFLTQGTFSMAPDLNYCNYLILMGSQTGFMLDSNPVIRATKMAEARMRGMKLVVIDPICTAAAAKANEWLPIRPGTDGALALAMLNVLLNELGTYDAEFLKKYTNGPYLTGSDGHYLRDQATNKPLIWDPVDGKTKTYDNPDIKDTALEGSYKVNGTEVQPAFQRLKEEVRKYPCEEVAEITTIPAETIRRIAQEFGEAARIGSKITIEGKELPYRPAGIYARKGVNSHKHSLQISLAIQLLNIVVGSIDVPGGILGTSEMMLPNDVASFSWQPEEGPDGMILPATLFRRMPWPYPAREVKPPEYISLIELYPVCFHSEPFMIFSMLRPEMFKLPYKLEALLHAYTNVMMNSANPETVAAWLKMIPFMVSFAQEINETVEFADIVLPDVHFLERLDLFANRPFECIEAGVGDWYYIMRQPVVAPPSQVRQYFNVLMEIAERVGFLRDLNHMLNISRNFKDPYQLELGKRYRWEEVCDRWAKNSFGSEHGLAWFKEHGHLKWPKQIEEAYPRPFLKPRIPIYFEHLIKAGEDVKRVTKEMGLDGWDISDYRPIPDWKPCPAYAEKSPGYDLYTVNFRPSFHTLTFTTNNVWLNELGERHPSAYSILVNGRVAARQGIKDGDLVWLETATGERVRGKVRVTEGIHPEAVGVGGLFGHWAAGLPVAKDKGVHFNSLFPTDLDRLWESMDSLTGALDMCIKVKISKAG